MLDVNLTRFQEELGAILYQIRVALERAGIGHYREFLMIREPSDAERYIILGHPDDPSHMREALINLHVQKALEELGKVS